MRYDEAMLARTLSVTALVGVALTPLALACGSDAPSPNDANEAADAASLDVGAPPETPEAGGMDVATGPDGATGGPCVVDTNPGHHLFECDGIKYDLETPPICTGGGCGVVLDVHGLTMTADQEDKSTKLRVLGSGHGFVVVQPTAPRGLIGPSWTPVTDDAKVWAALGAVRAALKVDPERVHVTGFSQGGAMTLRLLCAHGDEIASAAPVAAADGRSLDGNVPPFRLDCPFDATTKPAAPRSILQMPGTLDALVPIDKGKLQRDAILAWLGTVTDSVVASDASFTRTRYASAAKGVVFEYVQHGYVVTPPILPVAIGGHCLPGGDDLRGQVSGESMFFSCAPPNGFVWGEILMDFFIAHPRGK